MHKRHSREGCVRWLKNYAHRFFDNTLPELLQADGGVQVKLTRSGPSEFSQMSACSKTLSQVFRERADIGSGGTYYSDLQISRAIVIVFKQCSVPRNRFELMDTDRNWSTFNFPSESRKLVKFATPLFLS